MSDAPAVFLLPFEVTQHLNTQVAEAGSLVGPVGSLQGVFDDGTEVTCGAQRVRFTQQDLGTVDLGKVWAGWLPSPLFIGDLATANLPALPVKKGQQRVAVQVSTAHVTVSGAPRAPVVAAVRITLADTPRTWDAHGQVQVTSGWLGVTGQRGARRLARDNAVSERLTGATCPNVRLTASQDGLDAVGVRVPAGAHLLWRGHSPAGFTTQVIAVVGLYRPLPP